MVLETHLCISRSQILSNLYFLDFFHGYFFLFLLQCFACGCLSGRLATTRKASSRFSAPSHSGMRHTHTPLTPTLRRTCCRPPGGLKKKSGRGWPWFDVTFHHKLVSQNATNPFNIPTGAELSSVSFARRPGGGGIECKCISPIFILLLHFFGIPLFLEFFFASPPCGAPLGPLLNKQRQFRLRGSILECTALKSDRKVAHRPAPPLVNPRNHRGRCSPSFRSLFFTTPNPALIEPRGLVADRPSPEYAMGEGGQS